jgi:hypothetical protein
MRSVGGSAMFGESSSGGPTPRAPAGRPCDVEGCLTILSTYNPSDVCWLHAGDEYRHAPRRQTRSGGLVILDARRMWDA